MTINFDDLDELITEAQPGVDVPDEDLAVAPGALHYERCTKCGGSGQFRSWSGRQLGSCFVCKGAGKTSPEARAKARANAAANKGRNVDAWKAEHPVAAAWIAAKAGKFGFATALNEALAKYGHLTDAQLAAAEKCAKADAEREVTRAAEREAIKTSAPVVSVDGITEAFAKAVSNGLKRPKLRIAALVFSLAPATGKNAGALYVKQDGEYLGKIVGGKYERAYSASQTAVEAVLAACVDPLGAAVSHGRLTGSCACCGKELTNRESVERGIGPICAGKFGW